MRSTTALPKRTRTPSSAWSTDRGVRTPSLMTAAEPTSFGSSSQTSQAFRSSAKGHMMIPASRASTARNDRVPPRRPRSPVTTMPAPRTTIEAPSQVGQNGTPRSPTRSATRRSAPTRSTRPSTSTRPRPKASAIQPPSSSRPPKATT